jgi:hypothetical protein
MASCPICAHEIRTPLFFNLDAWTHLRCPGCKSRLEMQPPKSALFGSVIAPLFILARHGAVIAVIAITAAIAIMFWVLLECMFPKVRVRKKTLAKPAVWLKIDSTE